MFNRLFLIFLFLCVELTAQERMVQSGDLRLWTESFGEEKNPPLLLIMGAASQGILWPTAFCEQLAACGFFVIRYDHRDVGLSSSLNYQESPYTLIDLAKDAVSVLEGYAIPKAHVIGASMGGCVASLMGVHFSEKVSTLTLLMTTLDLSATLHPSEPNHSLPAPKPEYLAWIKEVVALNTLQSEEEKAKVLLRGWSIKNGTAVPFDECLYQQLVLQTIQRTQNPLAEQHHLLAMNASISLLQGIHSQIRMPTQVIHGSADPIFSIEHGKALANAIPDAHFILFEGMGHNLNPFFYESLISAIHKHARVPIR